MSRDKKTGDTNSTHQDTRHGGNVGEEEAQVVQQLPGLAEAPKHRHSKMYN